MPLLVLGLALLQPVALITIAQGSASEIRDAREIVVRSADEWASVWKSHRTRDSAPVVDFSRDMAAAVFLGTRPTGGFSVEIVDARREKDVLTITYVERRPDPGDIVTQALSQPFHIVTLPRHDGVVRFERRGNR